MSDTTTITPDERAEWRERLTSKFSCFDTELGGFTLRLLTALEQAEARAERAESAQLALCDIALELGCACDNEAMLLAVHGLKVRAEKAESERKKDLAHCKYEFELAEDAAANVARLAKMVDWLAEKCAMHCHDKARDDILCSNDTCDMRACWGSSGDEWKEAASRAVAAGEE